MRVLIVREVYEEGQKHTFILGSNLQIDVEIGVYTPMSSEELVRDVELRKQTKRDFRED